MKTAQLSDSVQARLADEKNIWMATNRASGKPHLVPVWFVWYNELIYICISPTSVKARNLAANPQIAMSLEDGSDVVICEGSAETIPAPFPEQVIADFKRKYDWDITTDADYGHVVAITPDKWLVWPQSDEA